MDKKLQDERLEEGYRSGYRDGWRVAESKSSELSDSDFKRKDADLTKWMKGDCSKIVLPPH